MAELRAPSPDRRWAVVLGRQGCSYLLARGAHLGSEIVDERARLLTLAHAIRQRIYLFVAIVAGLTVVAGVAAMVRPPSYRATVVMSVDERFQAPQGFDISLQTGQPLVDHFIQLASSSAVLDRACSGAYGVSCSAAGVAGSVSASAADGPGWISVSVSANSSARATALANAVSRAMIDQNVADDARLVAPVAGYLNADLQKLQDEISAQQAAGDKQHVTLLQQQYAAISQRITDLAIVQLRMDETLDISQPATPPSAPYDPDPVRYLAVGLIAGVVVAVAVVLLVDRLDDRLLDTESLAAAAGTRLVIAAAARDSESLTIHASNPYAVALANLRATHPHLEKLMVVGASEFEQLRPIGSGLGAASVRLGQTVMVLDPDSPALVMGQQTGRHGSLVTTEAPSPAADYDLVITLVPPPDANPIALSLARSGEVAVVVATAGSTRFSQVRRTAEALRLAGVDIAAAILSINEPKRVAAPDEGPSGEVVVPALRDLAAIQQRLPTWRGPGA